MLNRLRPVFLFFKDGVAEQRRFIARHQGSRSWRGPDWLRVFLDELGHFVGALGRAREHDLLAANVVQGLVELLDDRHLLIVKDNLMVVDYLEDSLGSQEAQVLILFVRVNDF